MQSIPVGAIESNNLLSQTFSVRGRFSNLATSPCFWTVSPSVIKKEKDVCKVSSHWCISGSHNCIYGIISEYFIDISLMYESYLFGPVHLYLLIASFWQLWVEIFVQNSSVFSGLITSQSFIRYSISKSRLEVFWSTFRFNFLKINSHPHDPRYEALFSHVAVWTITWLSSSCMVGLRSAQQWAALRLLYWY